MVVLVIVAISIPVVLGVVLVHGSLPLPVPQVQTSTGSSTPNTVYLPLGAGGPQQLNFSPATLTVAAGTTITFVDQDTYAPHDVYFTSVPAGASVPTNPSPVLTNGDTFTVTLTTPGTYHYECQFHPLWMQATIVVTG